MTSTSASDGASTKRLSPTSHNDATRNLSRSPHPYHRRSSSLQKPHNDIRQDRVRYNESSDSVESDERGTEADDEKGPILKGLPAPPLRGRKGLRGSKSPAEVTPAISPFPTPPAVDDRRSSYFASDRPRKASKSEHKTQAQALEDYKRYVKRRRAEIARRCTEASLVVLIGVCASNNALRAGRFGEWHYELLAGSAVLAFLCTLLPFRVALGKYRNGSDMFTALKTGFHIPSRFDPGALIYPVTLPFLISVSLPTITADVVATNVVLGLSSLPQKVITFGNTSIAVYTHWIFTIIPLINSTSSLSSQQCLGKRSCRIQAEDAALLLPLHQATLATLKYLTSTSLDPAEIQLLSTGLINLYLFASSPQSEILKALLWVGALCIFASCQKPLSWEVRLARIPSWKFARNKSPRTGLLSVFENVLNTILPQSPYKRLENLGSDDEDYEHLKSARRMARKQNRLKRTKTGGPQSDLDPLWSEKEQDRLRNGANGLQRSLTLSANGTYPSSPIHRPRNLFNANNTGLLSLTFTQAQACKWLISGYVFVAVATIILVVVRYYVSVRALSSYEPFGWAIGYLFGNVQPLRFWIVSNNLETWINLPSHSRHSVLLGKWSWAEKIRQTQLGPANVRLLIAAYCTAVLTAGIGIVLRLGAVAEVDTRRKVFHGIMVVILLPTIFIDPCFIALALSLILAIFLLLDLFRASQLPPISRPLTTFLAPYVDGRDYRGPVIVSHIFLLIGCAIPLWLSLAGAPRTGQDPWVGWEMELRDISMVSGVVCVGMGDAAASLIGRRYGRTKWFWGGGKSLEGSFAFAFAVTMGLAASYIWLRLGGWVDWNIREFPVALFKMALAGTGASIMESVLTAGNDNVIVPIALWLLTRGLKI